MILAWLARILMALLFSACPAWAAHHLITDDTGTQGRGNFQIEVAGQYDWDKESAQGMSVKSEGGEIATTLSCGISENVDLVLGITYLWGKVKEGGTKVYGEQGFADTVVEAKWRLFEKGAFSLALKPGITIPTGNDEKDLGTGRLGGQLFLIASHEMEAWALHSKAGYIRNENNADERTDIWHASVATTWEPVKKLQLGVNIGIERNPDHSTNNHPAFITGGLIYSVTEKFDIDLGVKYGLSKSETDISLMAGIAYRF